MLSSFRRLSIALLFGWIASASFARAATELKVLSFNILQGGGNAANVGFPDSVYDGFRLDDIARVIEGSGADLVGLQELGASGRRLLEELGEGWNLEGTILSRYPLRAIESGTFSICRVTSGARVGCSKQAS